MRGWEEVEKFHILSERWTERRGASKTLLKCRHNNFILQLYTPHILYSSHFLALQGKISKSVRSTSPPAISMNNIVLSILWVDFGSDLMLALACQEPNGNVCMPNWFKFALTDFHHNLTLSWKVKIKPCFILKWKTLSRNLHVHYMFLASEV